MTDLGQAPNGSLPAQDQPETTYTVHPALLNSMRSARIRLTLPDREEIEILQRAGAFRIPPKPLCDKIVEAYFRWVAPIIPVINQRQFRAMYNNPANPPSLLLLQAVLLAGSRACASSELMDGQELTTSTGMTFFKRAKALYDANYESEITTIVQALILIGWYWEGSEGKWSKRILR